MLSPSVLLALAATAAPTPDGAACDSVVCTRPAAPRSAAKPQPAPAIHGPQQETFDCPLAIGIGGDLSRKGGGPRLHGLARVLVAPLPKPR